MNKILVPVDFSNQAYMAIETACELARLSHSEVHLLNVLEYPTNTHLYTMGEPNFDSMDNMFFVQLLDIVKSRMKKIAADPRFCNSILSYDVQVGSPFRGITDQVEQKKIDLIVMGTKGENDLEQALIGSNTEKVVRHSKCPVITVKEKVNVKAIKNIVFATNLTEEQGHVIDELKKLQKLFEAKLHILKVNTPNSFASDRKLNVQLRGFVHKYNFENYTLNIYNDLNEEDGINYFAEHIKADMIAIGTHGRSGIMQLLGGSIAEDLAHYSKRPVWTCRI